MHNHFRALGLPIDSKADFHALVRRVLNEGELLPTNQGSYMRWSPGQGVEMWAQMNEENQPVGFKPHFRGESRVEVDDINLLGWDNTDIVLHGWVKYPEGMARADNPGVYPLVCALPAYYVRTARLEKGQRVAAQIAAFAHDLTCFTDENHFYAAQQAAEGKDGNWTANFFVPSGLFVFPEHEGEQVMPKPEAMFAGTVRAARLLHNAETGLDFWALSVETCDATLDVVADPAIVRGFLKVGCIVRGSYYLSARLLGV